MDNNGTRAFTVEYSKIVDMLECDLKISEDYDYDTQEHIVHPPMYEFKGIFDTGATNSVISANVIDKLGLKSVGREKVYQVKEVYIKIQI